MDSKTRRSLALVSLLFFGSGASSLVYEVVWFKRFAQVWGSSAMALASVVACFLFGLGIGARIFGGVADGTTRPLTRYALCELGIALGAFLVPFELGLLGDAAAAWYGPWEASPLLGIAGRLALTAIVIGPPCVLMGATLPLLIRQLVLLGQGLGRSTSWLYAVNSLGAALGAGIAGFHLLPRLGLTWTHHLAVAFNLAIAVGAWSLAPRIESSSAPMPERAAGDSGSARPLLFLQLAALLTGGSSLILQMVWARELTTLLGATTYAYSAMLAVFILGIAGGSLIFRLIAPSDDKLGFLIPSCVVLLLLSTVLGFAASPDLAMWVGSVRAERAGGFFNAYLCLAVSAVLEGIPTVMMGFLFPALVQISRSATSNACQTVGRLYAWNTAGSILCAFGTAPFLFPHVGTKGAVTIALSCSTAALLLLVLRAYVPRGLPTSGAVLLSFVLVGHWAFDAQRDPRETNLGFYLYGTSRYADPLEDTKLLFFREGPAANVLVIDESPWQRLVAVRAADPNKRSEEKDVTIRINGKIDGGSLVDMQTQLGMGLFPHFVRPQARKVLIVGFGTGTTAGASLLFPDTQVDCVEIEPGMFAASRFFHHVNHRPDESPRFRAIVGDARSHVFGTDRMYDLILSEPSNPWIAGIANLFTQEFFEAARARLSCGGVFAQWIQAHSTSAEDYALIVRTLRTVFRHLILLSFSGTDTILLASNEPILPSAEGLAQAQRVIDTSPALQSDLERYFGLTDVRSLLLAHILLDGEGLINLLQTVGGYDIHTDANLRLEFRAPRSLFRLDGDLLTRVPFEIDIRLYRRLILGWGFTAQQTEGLRIWYRRYHGMGLPEAGDLFALLGNQFDPDDVPFLIVKLDGETDPRAFEAGVSRLMTLSPDETERFAGILAERDDIRRARTVVDEYLRQKPAAPDMQAFSERLGTAGQD